MRYFIVTYAYIDIKGHIGYGDICHIFKMYPRRKFIESDILKEYPALTSIAIQNIIELSEADYESYKS